MNTQRLHAVLQQHRVSFLACFRALTSQDYALLLEAPSETLLTLLQQRYGYTRSQAKTAWNDFVLRYVDGRPLHDARGGIQTARRTHGQAVRWQLDTGTPIAWRKPLLLRYH
jgi:hypothetical protein